jgi:hypothetical protein
MERIWNESESLEDAVVNAYSFGIKTQSRTEVIEKIEQLAKDRWREVKKFVPPPAYPVMFDGCKTDDYGTVIDPISLEEIPEEKLISFEENGKKWCFNIESLFEYTERGQFINPLTRNPLDEKTRGQIEEYKQKEREVIVTVRFSSRSLQRYNFEMKFIKGFSYVELVVELFRTWSSSIHKSSPELFADYLVFKGADPLTNFEDEVEGDVEVIVRDHPPFNPAIVAKYYHDLSVALEKRPSLETFFDFAMYAFEQNLVRLSFVEAVRLLNPSGEIGLVVRPNSNPNVFSRFRTVQDYLKPLNRFPGQWMVSVAPIPGRLEPRQRLGGNTNPPRSNRTGKPSCLDREQRLRQGKTRLRKDRLSEG